MLYMESNLNNNILETKWNSSIFFQWVNNLYNLIRQNKQILDQSDQNNELYIVKFNMYNMITDENLTTINWMYDLFESKYVTISTIPYVGVYTKDNIKYFDVFLNWKIVYYIDNFIAELENNVPCIQEELANINSKVSISFDINLETKEIKLGYNYDN